MKLTTWYPVSIKPVRVGVYIVSNSAYDTLTWYSYWNGKAFCYWSCFGVDHAFKAREQNTPAKATQWRGVAK